jgi:hypothetical protein
VTSLPAESTTDPDLESEREIDPEVESEVEGDDEDLRAADGRVPGRRGRATRARLLECTAEMLQETSYRDLKVVEIARGAGT